eukprot:TRINITY_DN142_c0_g1_i1.p1 TRINITY_DN142_c0_g1~~TRINITY_DN142_c0_g1_i1.p1  ORF type:complete len:288 (+),score=27.85 TRINITY_DN142_c0_g1_i1:254-1117(+)
MSSKNIIFIGTGSSTGIPVAWCLLQKERGCEICLDALRPNSKNKRRNPSILIQYNDANILIDCGKTFRDGMINALIQHKIYHINAVIITHGHADAILGLDDLREWTVDRSIPVYVRDQDFTTIRNVFPYLVNVKNATGSGFVSKLDFHTIFPEKEFVIEGLKITPFVVEHGLNSTSLGFFFGSVVYISDVSLVTPEVYDFLKLNFPNQNISLLIIDALRTVEPNLGHLSLPQALDVIRALKPKKSYLVGMCHDFDHDQSNLQLQELLKTENIDVSLSYDGLKIPVDI